MAKGFMSHKTQLKSLTHGEVLSMFTGPDLHVAQLSVVKFWNKSAWCSVKATPFCYFLYDRFMTDAHECKRR